MIFIFINVYSNFQWKKLEIGQPLTSSFKYTLPIEVINAKEIMIQVGIPTLNCTKQTQHIFFGNASGFSFFSDASYNYRYSLYFSREFIQYDDGIINGWSDGSVSVLRLYYR